MTSSTSRILLLAIGLAGCNMSFGQAAGAPSISNEQEAGIPSVYSQLASDEQGLYLEGSEGEKFYEIERPSILTLENLRGSPRGTENGIAFDFGETLPTGTMYYGFIPYGDSRHPLPVFFKSVATISEGKTSINISELDGRYDMIGWEESEQGTIGYRILNSEGSLLYDGKISFKGSGPFEIDQTLVEGPFVDDVQPDGAIISFTANMPLSASVMVGEQAFESTDDALHHEIKVSGLAPATTYDYTVFYGENQQSYSFKTAPAPGSRSGFTFAYASDSRSGRGGGERDLYGANAYIMNKIMALATQEDAAFLQFTGDLVDGYVTDPDDMALQFANWKAAVAPYGHYMPIYEGMGNHEALLRGFDDGSPYGITVDRFPFATESAEAVFARNFTNPVNGPASEDGASYDPNSNARDFPSYQENVFYYTYDNIAVVVMNSDYFYAPSTAKIPLSSGGVHGYIMDQQLAWFRQTMEKLEADDNIDHIFMTTHTPFFPNGGHVHDSMWYHGNNEIRPYVAGKPLDKGVIERRDQLLDIFVNQSDKGLALLTGDEHNYSLTTISPDMPRYPEGYEPEEIALKRTIYQVNNGAAGAPYYAQEQTPWSAHVSGFTTQNALVLFHIEGEKVSMEVLNPNTLETVFEKQMR